MRKKTDHGGAGMIHGVRTPMAAPMHGLVGSNRNKIPEGCHNATSGHKVVRTPTEIKSPMERRDLTRPGY